MTLPNQIRTGGEIDAFCTKCDLNLAHTILAMVGPKVEKVQCNTCHSPHKYRGQQPLVKSQSFAAPKKPSASRASSSSSSGSTRTRAGTTVITFDEQLKGKDLSRAKKYSIRETFVVDEVVDHPTFGLGIVTAVRGDKVDISFKQEDKTLVHGKGTPPAAETASSNG
jgi:hypothetical protein